MTPFFIGIGMAVYLTVIVYSVLRNAIRSMRMGSLPPRVQAVSRPALSILVIGLFCVLYVSMFAGAIGYASMHPSSSIWIVYDSLFHECEQLPVQSEKNKKIILRLDDVQAYGWTDISITMMNDARKRGIPIVAGVIPHKLNTDQRIVRYLKKYGCTMEVALHGYKHGLGESAEVGVGEYAYLTPTDALTTTRLALGEFGEVVKTKPVTFIPPNNVLSLDAYEAVQHLGIPIISAADTTMYGFDTHTYAHNVEKRTADIILKECEARWEASDPLCVVMLHPQDYTSAEGKLDRALYNDYLVLLDTLASRSDVEITTFRECKECISINN